MRERIFCEKLTVKTANFRFCFFFRANFGQVSEQTHFFEHFCPFFCNSFKNSGIFDTVLCALLRTAGLAARIGTPELPGRQWAPSEGWKAGFCGNCTIIAGKLFFLRKMRSKKSLKLNLSYLKSHIILISRGQI